MPNFSPSNRRQAVFCAHGAGFLVPWDQVPEYMHVESAGMKEKKQEDEHYLARKGARGVVDYSIDEEQIDEIF